MFLCFIFSGGTLRGALAVSFDNCKAIVNQLTIFVVFKRDFLYPFCTQLGTKYAIFSKNKRRSKRYEMAVFSDSSHISVLSIFPFLRFGSRRSEVQILSLRFKENRLKLMVQAVSLFYVEC